MRGAFRSTLLVAEYAIIRGMRALRNFKPDRCYHLISRIANRAFYLTDEERTRFAAAEVSPCGQGKEVGLVSYSTTPTPPLGSGPSRPDPSRSRQVANALAKADELARKNHRQYICMLNASTIDNPDFKGVSDITREHECVKLVLTDESPEKSLLGFRFQ